MAHEDKVYQVIFDPTASDRISNHFELLARVSVPAANILLDALIIGIRSLESSPYRNPEYTRPYLPQGRYRYIVLGNRYRVVYKVDCDFDFMGDIQDCRQDDDKSLLKQ